MNKKVNAYAKCQRVVYLKRGVSSWEFYRMSTLLRTTIVITGATRRMLMTLLITNRLNKVINSMTQPKRKRKGRRRRKKWPRVPSPSISITSRFFTTMFSRPSPSHPSPSASPHAPRSLTLLQSHQLGSFSSSLSPPRILQHIKYSRPALPRLSSRALHPDASISTFHPSPLLPTSFHSSTTPKTTSSK